MAFPKWTNQLPILIGVPVVLAVLAGAFVFYYYGTFNHTDVGYAPKQPIAFSHQLHAGQLGVDCRYCHTEVEKAAHANLPGTDTCMNCHAVITKGSRTGTAEIAKIKASADTGKPIPWVRIHRLADYAHFDHSRHVQSGVACVTCHGRIDRMETVHQVQPLNMGWCLECHRKPDAALRPTSEVTRMNWKVGDGTNAADFGKKLREAHGIAPRQDCNTCHR